MIVMLNRFVFISVRVNNIVDIVFNKIKDEVWVLCL